jgi:WS/DGAT/MGAT family acyltransferase
VNDVMMAALAGALRSYLEERGGPVKDIRAVVPFNLRPLDEPLPADLGNRFGLVFASMPVGVADRMERVAETKRRMAHIKHSAQGPVSFAILTLTGMGPQQVEDVVVSIFGSKGSAVVTNVPGPTQPIYLAGTRVAGCVSWVPSSGRIPLGVCIFSYDGKVFVGVVGDTLLVPRPERIVEAFRAELEALLPAPV